LSEELTDVPVQTRTRRLVEILDGSQRFVDELYRALSPANRELLFIAAQNAASYHEFLDNLEKVGTVGFAKERYLGPLYSRLNPTFEYLLRGENVLIANSRKPTQQVSRCQLDAMRFWMLARRVYGSPWDEHRRALSETLLTRAQAANEEAP